MTVHDNNGEKIGKGDDLFLNENDRPEYFGVKMGFLGMSSSLIPSDVTTLDREGGVIEVSQSKSTVKDGSSFEDDREITLGYENEVRSYYGLSDMNASEQRGAYGTYYAGDDEHASRTGDAKEERRDREREEAGAVGPDARTTARDSRERRSQRCAFGGTSGATRLGEQAREPAGRSVGGRYLPRRRSPAADRQRVS